MDPTIVTTTVDQAKCIGCGACVETCPARTLTLAENKAVVSGQRCIGCGHCLAVCPTGAVSVPALGQGNLAGALPMRSFSFDRKSLPPGQSDPAELARLMASRRSCRAFDARPVSRDVLQDLVSFGRMAPSASNTQLWTFTILPNREAVEALVNETAEVFHGLNTLASRPLARRGLRLVGKPELEWYAQHYLEANTERVRLWRQEGVDRFFYDAPAALIIGSKPGSNMAAADCNLAAENVMLAAHALGLGSCYIGFALMALQRSEQARQRIGMPTDETPHVVLALGICSEKFRRQAGRLPADIRFMED